MSVLPPPLSDLYGTCDWGYCDGDVVDWRLSDESWDSEHQLVWLPVCEEHRLKFSAGPQHPGCGYLAIGIGEAAICMKCGWSGANPQESAER